MLFLARWFGASHNAYLGGGRKGEGVRGREAVAYSRTQLAFRLPVELEGDGQGI